MVEDTSTQIARMDERIKGLEKAAENILMKLEHIDSNLAARLERVEVNKLAANEFVKYRGDVEDRFRRIERLGYTSAAVVGILQALIIGIVIKYFFR